MAGETYHAVGKRKTSVARVWMKPGSGKISINSRPIEEYIKIESGRNLVMQPLMITETSGKYDISVNVKGGGMIGQAGAIRHGISRVLVEMNPLDARTRLQPQGGRCERASPGCGERCSLRPPCAAPAPGARRCWG